MADNRALIRSLYAAFEQGDVKTIFDNVDPSTRARLKSSGGVFDCDWAHVFTVKNGRLSRFRAFYDAAAIVGAIAA